MNVVIQVSPSKFKQIQQNYVTNQQTGLPKRENNVSRSTSSAGSPTLGYS